MDVFYTTQITIPIIQIAMLLTLSTLALLFGRTKLALLINYVFILYWGYAVGGRNIFLGGDGKIDLMNATIYFGFGILVVMLACIFFLTHSD